MIMMVRMPRSYAEKRIYGGGEGRYEGPGPSVERMRCAGGGDSEAKAERRECVKGGITGRVRG